MTGLSTTFNVCFALLPNESESAFFWVLQNLKKLADKEGIRSPFVIVTDFDKALKNAIANSSGNEVTMQICLWHVLKNIAFHIKTKWLGSVTGTAVQGIAENVAPEGETAAGNVASRLLDNEDRNLRLGNGLCDAQIVALGQTGSATESSRKYENNVDSILLAFRTAVYADTAEEFWGFWTLLKQEFSDQGGRVNRFLLFLCSVVLNNLYRYHQLYSTNLASSCQ